ncbi:MAG: hypothetical protein EOO92_00420 [Pedobacter sp.]|nr:MAG: hypothetical protein EOO92_00420 [Pedobacter sp.]
MDFKVIATVLCISLLLVLAYGEVKRANKAHLAWRLFASVIAVVCLLLMVIPIKYQVDSSSSNKVNLITEGVHPDTIQKINGALYTTDRQLAKQNTSKKVTYIPDLSYFLNINPAYSIINVYGYGLPDEELLTLKERKVNFYPALQPDGFAVAHWNQIIKASSKLFVQGVYNNSSSKSVKLVLKGFGADVDSTTVRVTGKFRFSFGDRPSQLGKAVYQLIAIEGKDTLYSEPIPFETKVTKPLNVIVLASYPDFEYKFLKNWLFEEGFSLMIRTRISKDKYSADFLNMDGAKSGSLNAQAFKKADVVIADEEELNSLSADEFATLSKSVKAGLGLIIRKNMTDANSSSRIKQNSYEIADTTNSQLKLVFPGDSFKFSSLPLNQRKFLKTGLQDQVITKETSGKVLVTKRLDGMGVVLSSTLTATYNWMLSDQAPSYHKYWSEIISAASRKSVSINSFQLYPRFVGVSEKARIVIQQRDDKVPAVLVEGVKVSPRQNMMFPFEWDVFSWEGKAGWNSLSVNKVQSSFYRYNSEEWKPLKAYELIELNKVYLAGLNKDIDRKSEGKKEEKQVSIWIFFIGFLFSAGYLWVEPRILAKNID